MITIKFRLLSPSKNIIGYEKWYQGSSNEYRTIMSQPCWLYSYNGEKWTTHEIKSKYKDTFTGLLDKNGKEIYEGDIVQYENKNSFRKEKSVVEWVENYLPRQGDYGISGFLVKCLPSQCEIIGNIYQHSHLFDNTDTKTYN